MKLFVFAVTIVACSAARLEHLEKQKSAYLPPGQDSLDASSALNSNTIGGSGGGHQSFNNGGTNQNLPSDIEPSSSANDPELSGYVYGPGISGNGNNNQQPSQQAPNNNHFGQQPLKPQRGPQGTNQYSNQESPTSQFGQQGNNQYPNEQTPYQKFGQQATYQYSNQQRPNQQFGQQGSNQYTNQQSPNQQFGQQGTNQYSSQQRPNQQLGQQGTNQFAHQDATSQGTNSYGVQDQFQSQPSFTNSQNLVQHSSQRIPQQSFDEETGYHY